MSAGRWAALGLVAVAAAVGVDVVAGGPLSHRDAPVLAAAVAVRTPALTGVVLAVTRAGAWPARVLIGAALAVPLAWRARSWTPAVRIAVALALAPAASGGLKRLVGRARPPATEAVVTPGDPSFPSGHATGAAALAVVAVAVLLTRGTGRVQRAGVVLAGAAYALAVGASRVYLGAHWLTDVLAGEALGAAIGLAAAGLGPWPRVNKR